MYLKKARGPQIVIPKRNTRWILVANRSDARIFVQTGLSDKPSLLKTFDHPAGRKKNHELKEGVPGRSYSSWSGSHSRHTMAPEVSPEKQEELSFARTLAAYLDAGRRQQAYDDIVVVAEAHFLGVILSTLDSKTKRLVKNHFEKNLIHFDNRQTSSYLQNYLSATSS